MATRVERSQPPLIVIVGPTASGKTSLAIDLAACYGGEIICADSRTVYKGMDIGTAKPTLEEQSKVPHWGIDLIDPGQRFTAADFKQYARTKIDEIRARGHVPFIVGGTGLYVDGLLFDYQFSDKYDQDVRSRLETYGIEDLHIYCNNNNIELPANHKNRRHLIRAIEQKSINNKRNQKLGDNIIVVGLATGRDELRTRIATRVEQMLANDVVGEAIRLGKKYGWDSEAMTANVYKLVKLYLKGVLTDKSLKEKNTTSDWKLAKRQMTWFRRNPHIYWGDVEQIRDYLVGVLEGRGMVK